MSYKIAIVLNSSWAAYNFRYNLAEKLQDQGYEITFIAPHDKYSYKLKEKFKFIDLSLSTDGTNPIKDLKTIFRLFKVYKKLKPDIVLHFSIKPNIYGTIVSNFLSIPSINNIAGLGSLFINNNFFTKVAKKLYKFSQKNATKIFFQNNDDFKLFLNEGLVLEHKCDRLPGSGVDLKKFKPRPKKNDGVFRFLIVSRMLWAKGIGEYVEAAKIIKGKYSNVDFLLLGFLDVKSPTAITKEQMDYWVENNQVKYIGVSDNVQDEISKVDCIVFPSYYREGVPRALLESASMSKPIITTDSVGCKEVVDDGVNGYLCKIKDVSDLVDKMEKMLNLSIDERTIMGEKGREKVIKEFSEEIIINKYLESISQILTNNSEK